jgi:hypothetical protein
MGDNVLRRAKMLLVVARVCDVRGEFIFRVIVASSDGRLFIQQEPRVRKQWSTSLRCMYTSYIPGTTRLLQATCLPTVQHRGYDDVFIVFRLPPPNFSLVITVNGSNIIHKRPSCLVFPL